MYLNKVIIYGNLTKDPELKTLPNGTSVCNFSIATNRYYKDKDGKPQDQVEYHNIVIFGRQAETVSQYMRKGSPLYVEGRLQTRSWESKDGSKRYITEIMAESTQFGPRTQRSSNEYDGGSQVESPTVTESNEINPDDIPF